MEHTGSEPCTANKKHYIFIKQKAFLAWLKIYWRAKLDTFYRRAKSLFLIIECLPPLVPDHCSSTFKYFLAVAKNTKTIRRAYMCDTRGVYRRPGTAKKCKQTIKHENFLRHWLLQTPGEENSKRRKKMIFPWR